MKQKHFMIGIKYKIESYNDMNLDLEQLPYFSKIVDEIEKDTEFITFNIDNDEFLNYVTFLKK